jgi:hypothetical protein
MKHQRHRPLHFLFSQSLGWSLEASLEAIVKQSLEPTFKKHHKLYLIRWLCYTNSSLDPYPISTPNLINGTSSPPQPVAQTGSNPRTDRPAEDRDRTILTFRTACCKVLPTRSSGPCRAVNRGSTRVPNASLQKKIATAA